MARSRNIKPGFFTNDDLVELPFEVRLLFIGLWTLADKEGRLEDRPKKIKMKVFPADDVDCDVALGLLATKKFLRRYVIGEECYIQIMNWSKHQNPHVKETPSAIPEEPGQAPDIPVQATGKPSKSALDSLNPLTDSGLPSTDSKPTGSSAMEYPPEFEDAWVAYPERPGASKKNSFKAWSARRNSGVTAEQLLDGVVRYAAFVKAKGTEPDYIKQPETFFGPGEHHKADWTIRARASPDHPTLGKAGQVTAANAQKWLENSDVPD